MIASEILELLRRFNVTLTIKPDGSWKLSNEKDEHFSSTNINELIEYVEFVICGKRRDS